EGGDDPVTFVRAPGGAACGALLDTAEPLIEAWLAEVVGPDRDAVRRRAEAAREVARLLQRLRSRDPDKFDVLAGRAAQTIGVAEERLRAEGVARRAPAPAGGTPRSAGPAEEALIRALA